MSEETPAEIPPAVEAEAAAPEAEAAAEATPEAAPEVAPEEPTAEAAPAEEPAPEAAPTPTVEVTASLEEEDETAGELPPSPTKVPGHSQVLSRRSSVVEELPKFQCLVLNAGSSSLKYALFDLVGPRDAKVVVEGLVEKIGAPMGKLKHEPADTDKTVIEQEFTDHRAAMDVVLNLLMDPATGQVKDKADIKVVGHRVVHGGESFTSAAVVDDEAMAAIRKAAALAPLHNPANITGIEVATELFPCPQVAVFDTAFHMTMPPASFMYAVPLELYKDHGVRRYGFHGSSYTYVTEAAAQFLEKDQEKVNLIVCHLGNGASMAAIRDGKCVDTTMGMTPLDGLVMGTRSGDVDPALHLHLTQATGQSLDDVNAMLNKKSGLQGLCGDSDMRAIQERVDKGDKDAEVALGVFIKRIRKYLGSFLVELGGKVDAVVFTAGIGENSSVVRGLVCKGLEGLGISIDEEKNKNKGKGIAAIHSASSTISVLVVPTNEELSITLQSMDVANIRVPRKPRTTTTISTGIARAPRTSSFKQAARKVSSFMTQKYAMAQETALADGVTECNSVYVVSMSERGTALFELGLFFRLHRVDPEVGFFRPISNRPNHQDTHTALIHQQFQLTDNRELMCGVDYDEAVNLLSTRQEDLLIDKIVEAYEKYRHKKRFVLISGVQLPVTSMDINLTMAAILRAPVLFQLRYSPGVTPAQLYEKVMLQKARMKEIPGSKFSGVAINRIPMDEFVSFNLDFREVMAEHEVPVAAVLPLDKLLTNFRINEIYGALNATALYGQDNMDRFETANFLIASGSTEQVLKECAERAVPCMVLVSASRTDVLLGLLFAVQSSTVRVSGILLAGAPTLTPMVKSLLDSVGTVEVPVLMVRQSLEEVIVTLKKMSPTVLPSSKTKIECAENLFDQYMDETYLNSLLTAKTDAVMTPKLFQYQIMKQAKSSRRHIVLPEGNDKRVVQAAAELAKRGLCKVTVLGNPADVKSLGDQLKVDLADVSILEPGTSEHTQRYADMLYEARKEKGMTPEKALDLVSMDPNYFGTMMMYADEAHGMVSGACHTTADTMRPALQIIKTSPGCSLVSSIFFMLLPEQVFVYGDCAINVAPDSAQLADIAVSSANTAKAFGITPRVALLSYATGDSNSGDLITKVREGCEKAKEMAAAQELPYPIEGPLQFDAAVDPEVAKVKVKTASEVAGKANVCIFPDLNTGNNAYKAVQQASGCIAMGPIMQGLKKPVNDLSRGCTVDDIVNTVVITCIQSL